MLIVDQLKKNDPQLRALAVAVLGGLLVLLAGLWWVQVVSAREYQANLETQSYRTVRIPAVRGKILDRNGVVLAENRPTYNVSLYLGELRGQFQREYDRIRPVRSVTNSVAFWRRWLGAPPVTTQYARLRKSQIEALGRQARYTVASNVVNHVGLRLRQPISFSATNFQRHYEKSLALPFPVLTNLTSAQIALFAEQSTSPMGVDLELQSTRCYPYGTTAAHILGHLQRDNDSKEGEDASFWFRMPDYKGITGVEYSVDKELRGMAGVKSVQVNNAGYRQAESVWSAAGPGSNVVLTIDMRIQQAAERALQGVSGAETRGAVVVMDVRSGDILAMVSLPAVDPNCYVRGITDKEWRRINDLHAEKSRATFENYMPGSIFKTVVGMAALEAGWNPDEVIHVEPNPAQPGKGYKKVGNHVFKDTAPPGDYTFRRALKLSSNSYFITCGLRVGPGPIIRLGKRLHFGEGVGLMNRQDAPGKFPDLQRLRSHWTDGNTGNFCIGQDPVWVTPIQIAVLTASIANGGDVLWPRLVDRIETADSTLGKPPRLCPSRLVRDRLGISKHTIKVLHDAMLADTEDPDGTGRKACLPGLQICGKTGTAQVQDVHNNKVGQTTWFASFAPYEQPRYAVVVMVEDGASGGETCAPVAHKIYAALLERDRSAPGRPQTLAQSN